MSVTLSGGEKPNRKFRLDYQPIYSPHGTYSTLSGSEFDMGQPR
jgi:hypothetical protein